MARVTKSLLFAKMKAPLSALIIISRSSIRPIGLVSEVADGSRIVMLRHCSSAWWLGGTEMLEALQH